MKPKRTTRQRKPRKAKRNSLDKRITKAATFDEKRRLALYGCANVPEGLELIVKQWQTVRANRAEKQKATAEDRAAFTSFAASVEKEVCNYVVSAMAHDRPDMLVALADEMKRQSQADEWQIDKLRWLLLDRSRCGAVNLSALKREAEQAKFCFAPLLTWQRVAKRWKVKTIADAVGRPRKLHT